MPIATKLGRMVTYNKELLRIKSDDSLTRGSCDVSWQIKYVISPVFLDQGPMNMASW